jgi:hypothetical protein
MHISKFFEFEQEDMGEPEKEDTLDEALQEKTTAEAEAPKPSPLIEGPESLQIARRALIDKFIDLLQPEVSAEPARLPPF